MVEGFRGLGFTGCYLLACFDTFFTMSAMN